eukprot:scaffold119431_cov78-Phaeocystis_antarctica.AAC.3
MAATWAPWRPRSTTPRTRTRARSPARFQEGPRRGDHALALRGSRGRPTPCRDVKTAAARVGPACGSWPCHLYQTSRSVSAGTSRTAGGASSRHA